MTPRPAISGTPRRSGPEALYSRGEVHKFFCCFLFVVVAVGTVVDVALVVVAVVVCGAVAGGKSVLLATRSPRLEKYSWSMSCASRQARVWIRT